MKVFFSLIQDLVEVVKGSEKGVLSLSEEVDSRRRELKDVQLQLASRNGELVFGSYYMVSGIIH